jgi:hypothetical protein
MKKYIFVVCAVAALAGAISVRANFPEYPYTFEPVTTSDGSPLNTGGGRLFLDSPSSPAGGGGLNDINMNASFLLTPFGSFSLSQSSGVSIGDVSKVPVPFTWDPTLITSMDITGFILLNEGGNIGVVDYAWEITDSSLQIQQPDPFATGPWVANIPDTGSTALLITLAAAGLYGFGNFSRVRDLVTT